MNTSQVRQIGRLLGTIALGYALRAAGPISVTVDFARPAGTIRALHGVNKGPLGPGGLLDLTAEQRALDIPSTRLHDAYWPNPYVVDVHAVFPDPRADPSLPESYDFRLTDEYIAAVRATGAQIVYRLGESIEHTTVKRHAHPPADPERWAAVCRGIIRHYNAGWAGGFHHGIRYWEIWNEPENRPAMWSGSDEDYFRLYRVAARAIKEEFPGVLVGGPAVGASGRRIHDTYEPTEFVAGFLRRCRDEATPLDFFSWHCYTDDPGELVARAVAVRHWLDGRGFTQTESHLNEWNFLPGNTWDPIARHSPALVRQRYYADMAGPPGAAFLAAALIRLQDAPLDMANLFHGETGPFGLFTEHGVPQKNYHALRAFRELLNMPQRVGVDATGGAPVTMAAGWNPEARRAAVLLSHRGETGTTLRLDLRGLPWVGPTEATFHLVDATHDLEPVQTTRLPSESAVLEIELPSPSVGLLQLKPAADAVLPVFQVTQPANRLVFQRNLQGTAAIPIVGLGAVPGAAVTARLTPVDGSTPTGGWNPITTARSDGTFEGRLNAPAGWYSLEVRSGSNAVTRIARVGVGEVFVVVGHSVAQGGEVNLPGSSDDRVNAVALTPSLQADYERTGDPRHLPEPVGTQFSDGVRPAPFGHGPYFWAQFGERVAQREQVPVLIFNAAFGGTSLDHWARSARGESFEHSFVKSGIRMPYINLRNTLQRYIALTGVRAVLADQGQNDAGEPDARVVFDRYCTWVDQARQDLGHASLAVVVNRQTPYPDRIAIRQAQERMIREVPHCFAGPDYDRLDPGDRPDRIHLGAAGAAKAAQGWAQALDARFLQQAVPYCPRQD